MPIKVQLEDPRSSFSTFVDDEGALSVSERFTPPYGVVDFIEPLAVDFADSTGNTDMRVNASAASPQLFFIEADRVRRRPADRYINTIVFTIADQNTTLRNFGSLSRLTNGCRLYYESERGEVTIRSGLASNFDFMRLSQGFPQVGNAGDIGRYNQAIGTGGGASDAYVMVLNFAGAFGTQFGIKLAAGSTQRIIVEINDNVSGVDEFTCIGYGFDRLDTRTKETALRNQR